MLRLDWAEGYRLAKLEVDLRSADGCSHGKVQMQCSCSEVRRVGSQSCTEPGWGPRCRGVARGPPAC